MRDVDKVINEAVKWIKSTVGGAGAKGVVFGLSGGIDSAVVAALCKKAFPENSLGVIMPCYSNPVDEEHALMTAEAIGLETKTVILDRAFDEMKSALGVHGDDPRLATANIKARLRMITVYYYAGLRNCLVAGTSNRCELFIGYFTKHGDAGVDFMPLAGFVKSEVVELAYKLGIPEIVITKAPTAGLWEGQSDEKDMGMNYTELDNYILTGNAEDKIREKVDGMHQKSEHKRRLIPKFAPEEKGDIVF
ncbi:MAG TPA: NAD(+) synthase [Bacillota bacterium]|nr:NAD(+) synthase [Bacillota bacterium]HOR87113.1 NAD(+) synthase [Bacillota bacterium]HPL53513.1 NAD(+) synthase [Bacillota bacterium]